MPYFIVILLSLVITSGCGLTNKIIEEAIEHETNNNTDIDFDDGSVSVKNVNGSEYQGNFGEEGEAVEIPASWPADVPVPDSITPVSVFVDNKGLGTLSFTTEESANDIYTEILSALEAEGWEVSAEINVQDSKTFSGDKEDRSIGVSVASNENPVQGSIIVMQK